MAGTEVKEYNGKPQLLLNPKAKHEVRLGVYYCKVIMEHVDDIKNFLDVYDEGSQYEPKEVFKKEF